MKKRKIWTQLNYEQKEGEHFTLPSETMPNLALTAQEILVRFSQGRPLGINRSLMYTGDEYMPDVRTMDLIEREDLILDNAERIKTLQDTANAKLGERRKAKIKAKQEFDELLSKLRNTTKNAEIDINNSEDNRTNNE